MNDQINFIYSYTREQALQDGLQVCVSERFADDTKLYKYPVYFTSQVWELCQAKGGIIWDICYMAYLKSKNNDVSIINFSVIVEGADQQPDFFEDVFPCYRLLAHCGAKDLNDPQPVITIMFPDEA